jgi:hypothetical protein
VTSGVGPCRNCGHHVAATATVCRYCGFDADTRRNERVRFVWGVLGLLATLTVVGAPVGLLLLWKAARHHRAMTGSVVETATQAPLIPALLASVRGNRTAISDDRSGGH